MVFHNFFAIDSHRVSNQHQNIVVYYLLFKYFSRNLLSRQQKYNIIFNDFFSSVVSDKQVVRPAGRKKNNSEVEDAAAANEWKSHRPTHAAPPIGSASNRIVAVTRLILLFAADRVV